MAGDLEIYTPTPRPVETRQGGVAILPLPMRHVQAFAQATAPVMPLLLAGDLQAAVSRNADAMIEAAALGSGKDAEWVGDLLPDDFMELVGAVIEVNADFFARRVLPATRRAAMAVRTAIEAHHGGTSSPGSPGTADTGSPTVST